MPIEIRWSASMSATGFHALDCVIRGRAVGDATIAPRLAPLVQELEQVAISLPPGRDLMSQLMAHCASVESNAQLARLALDKAVGVDNYRPSTVDQLVRTIDRLEAVIRAALPDGVDQIARGGQSLKSQWKAYGQGLLTEVGRTTDPVLIPSSAEVVLLAPLLGGYGRAHLRVNTVWMEATPVEATPGLPEVVRLAWLIAQLQCDVPIFAEHLPGGRLPRTAAFAMLPPISAAAQFLEIVSRDEAIIAAALQGWGLVDQSAEPATALAAALVDWWSTYTAARPHWSVALAALDQMVASN